MTEEKIEKKREFNYRGKNIEELKKLDIREFSKYLKSRARRSVLRNFDVVERFVQKCRERHEKGKAIRTHLRDIIIVPQMVGYNLFVYNGQTYILIKVTAEMIGHRLGEFAITRKQVRHGAPGVGATRSSASMSVK